MNMLTDRLDMTIARTFNNETNNQTRYDALSGPIVAKCLQSYQQTKIVATSRHRVNYSFHVFSYPLLHQREKPTSLTRCWSLRDGASVEQYMSLVKIIAPNDI